MNDHDRLRALDLAHVWHPFTQMQSWAEEEAPIIERGDGPWLIDVRGRRYLDGVSSLWCNVHGHRVPEIDRAVTEQLGRIAHTTLLGLASPPSIELAARLAEIAPRGLTRVFYSDSGSTAVEVALKLAFQYWRHHRHPEKRLFVSLAEAYHGDTIGSVSLGAIEQFHHAFGPLLFPRLTVPTPYGYRPPAGFTPETWGERCGEMVEELLTQRGAEIAAVVIEPLIQGAAGMITQPPGFLARVAAACRENDVLLVCDEVATGFGRTGTMFAVEQEGVAPDLLCLAKGLTGGYLPLAATLATDRVFEAFLGPADAGRTFFHGHTYTGNPLACAAALASLDLFRTERLLEKLPGRIARLSRGLSAVADLPHVGEIRQRGLMVGIELVKDRATREPYAAADRMGHRVILRAREHGVILRPLGNVVVLMPPLVLDEELDLLAEVTRRSIAEATEPGSESSPRR